MSTPSDFEQYSYRASVKSDVSDELINTYLLRPAAGLIVRVLYYTTVTPNQVTIASTIAGLCAAVAYLPGTPIAYVIAGILVTVKDLLDSADGQLARAKNVHSRTGRFLDSIGDFIVDAAVFPAIGWSLYQSTGRLFLPVLALAGLAGITFRVSYHVFYQVQFLHLHDQYRQNRVTEEVTSADRETESAVLRLQKIFQVIYGWQDRLVMRIDAWARNQRSGDEFLIQWYADTAALRMSGFLGFGTELFLLMVCSVLNRLELYLWLNCLLMNGILLGSILYHRVVLTARIRARRGASV